MTTTEKPDVQNVRMPVRYTFTDSEIAELAKKGVQFARAYESLEKDFTSIKADYKLRLTNLENERDRLDEKIADGFEMRDTACVCAFNTPTKGQKTFTREDTGELVRVEAMSHFDLEKELPLPKEEKKVLPDDMSFLGSDIGVEGVEFSAGRLGTNLGNALDQAAAGTNQPQVIIAEFDSPDWGAKTLRNEFKKAATKAGWPEAAVKTLLEQCKGSDVAAIRATMAPHVKGAVVPERDFTQRWGEFDGTHHLSVWGMIEPLKVETQLPAEMHELRKIETLSDDLKSAANAANWPDAAKQYLAHCIEGATLEELVTLADRLQGGPNGN